MHAIKTEKATKYSELTSALTEELPFASSYLVVPINLK
jgi:hypothetical protein